MAVVIDAPPGIGNLSLSAAELRRKRETAGLSTYQLAELLGVSAAAVKNWERGRKPVPRGRIPELQRVLAVSAPAQVPEMPGSELRELREQRGVSQNRLAELLGVSKPAISDWETSSVPEARREVLLQALQADVPVEGALLRALRQRAGLKQVEAAEVLGVTQAAITTWERGAREFPVEEWPAMRERLEAAAQTRLAELSQQPVTPEEIHAGVEALRWSLRDLAEAIGVPRGTVGPWASGAKPVPRERWAQIRETLGTSAPALERDRVTEAEPLVLAVIEATPGIMRSEAIAATAAPVPHARAALLRLLEQRRVYERPHPKINREGVQRMLPGLFPGRPPADLPKSKVEALAAEAVRIARARPGLTRAELVAELPESHNPGRDGLRRALREGLVHERAALFTNAAAARAELRVFAGQLPTSPAIAAERLEFVREQLLLSRAELASQLGVLPTQLRTWEAEGVPEEWREAVGQSLEPLERDARARAGDRERALVEAVKREPGRPRTPYVRLLSHSDEERRLLLAMIERLIAADVLHERPIPGNHSAGLHSGPPPAEFEPGDPMSSEELRQRREWAGYTQQELARLVGASGRSVNQWESGELPIPAYRRGQLRHMLAERKRAEPEPVLPEEVLAGRKRLGLNQTEFASRLGVTQSAVSSWERGRWPVPPELREPLRALLTAPQPEPAQGALFTAT